MPDFEEIRAPYAGLRPFESYEAPIFFGREAHISRLLQILRRERFLALIGTSGSGKSSLIRAGMLPALAIGWTGNVSDWRIAQMRPGDRPLRRLAEALLAPKALGHELAGTSASSRSAPPDDSQPSLVPLVEAELRRGPLGLVDLVTDALSVAGERSPFNLLVLVDQFEELFRYAESGVDEGNESEIFINSILQPRLETGKAAQHIFVALTMRTDALHECARFLELPEAINAAQYLTPRLKPEELRLAITEPARVFEGRVDPEVVTGLVNAVFNTPDQLPILQHALARMWETACLRNSRAPTISDVDVSQTGGIEEALSNHADRVFDQLSPLDQRHADDLFRAITAMPEGGTRDARRPQRLGDIARFAGLSEDDWQAFMPAVLAFGSEGVNFLRFTEPIDRDTVIDISHEALIRQWRRLARLVMQEAENAAAYRRWRDRSDHYWNEGGELLSGADLSTALRWRDGPASTGGPADEMADRADITHRTPTRAWAARYAQGSGIDDNAAEFDRVIEFLKLSEEAERRKIEAARSAVLERQLATERAAMAELTVERDRAQAAAREQELAQSGARRSRRFAAAALGVALIAVVAAGLATHFWLRATGSFAEAISVRLAGGGQAIVSQARIGGTLQGALQVLAAHRIRKGTEPYFALQSVTQRLDRVVRLIEASAPVSGVAISPNGKRIVSANGDNTLQLWDAQTGSPIGEPLRGHRAPVTSVGFSPDGERIASGSRDTTVRLWDAGTGRAIGEPMTGHTGWVLSVAFSADGKRLVSGGVDNTLRQWDVARGVALGEALRGHTGAVQSVAFSPDGRVLVSGSSDNTVRVWEAESGLSSGPPFFEHKGAVTSVAISPDGKCIASSGDDASVRLWNLKGCTASTDPMVGHAGLVTSVTFSHDGKRIASTGADRTVRVWETANGDAIGAPLLGHAGSVTSIAFSPDDKRLVSGSLDKTLLVWDPDRGVGIGEPLRGHDGGVKSLAISQRDGLIVSGGDDHSVRLWGAATGESLGGALRAHAAAVTGVAFAPDGATFVSGSQDGTILVWDTAKRAVSFKMQAGYKGAVSAVAISPDGSRIVSAADDFALQLWDAKKGTVLGKPWRGHTDKVRSVAFSPSGKRVASASEDNTLRIWNPDTGALVVGPIYANSGPVTSLAFSPDGMQIVTGNDDGTLQVWDAEKGAAVGQPMVGHSGPVGSVAFSLDGQRIASGSDDFTLRLWDANKKVSLDDPLYGHRGRVTSIAFSQDGTRIVSASTDGTLRVWPTLDGWAEALCAKLSRNMTSAEWAFWVGDVPYRQQCPNLPAPTAADDTPTKISMRR